jgi:hypothetical protein
MTYPSLYGPIYVTGGIMPAVPLSPYPRYFPPGNRKYYWLTAVANPAAPTRAELNAGTDLSGQIAAISGFGPVMTRSDVTPLGSAVVVVLNTIVDVNSGTNELLIYASADSHDVRLLMPPGSAGFVVLLPEGDISGQYCEVWPANVNAMFFEPATETPGEIHFQFTITGMPAQNVLIP